MVLSRAAKAGLLRAGVTNSAVAMLAMVVAVVAVLAVAGLAGMAGFVVVLAVVAVLAVLAVVAGEAGVAVTAGAVVVASSDKVGTVFLPRVKRFDSCACLSRWADFPIEWDFGKAGTRCGGGREGLRGGVG